MPERTQLVELGQEQSWEEIQGSSLSQHPTFLFIVSSPEFLPSNTWVGVPRLRRSLPGYVTLDMLLHFSVSQSPHLENSMHIFYFGAIMWINHVRIYIKRT